MTAHPVADPVNPTSSDRPLVGIVPVRGAGDVKVSYAAPRAIVPLVPFELVLCPILVNGHLHADPGPDFSFDLANVAG